MSVLEETWEPSRRAVLAGSGATAAALALAACGDGGGTGTVDTTVEAGEFLADTAKVPVGGSIVVKVGGAPIVVTQAAEGKYAAFSGICTHQGCQLIPGRQAIDCACHNAAFDLATGKVLKGPPRSPLPEVTITVDGQKIITA